MKLLCMCVVWLPAYWKVSELPLCNTYSLEKCLRHINVCHNYVQMLIMPIIHCHCDNYSYPE